MPRLKRRAKLKRVGYTDEHVEALWNGQDFRNLFPSDEDWRAGWEALRGELLPKWIAENPGTRPAVWWQFEAPERRRRVDGKPHPFDNPEREKLVARWRAEYPEVAAREAYKLHYGQPACLMVRDDLEAEYEPEADYLARLGLMPPEEAEAVKMNS